MFVLKWIVQNCECEAHKGRRVISIFLSTVQIKCSWSPHQLLHNTNAILCRCKLFDSTDGHCLQTWHPIRILPPPTWVSHSFKISLPWNLFFSLPEPRRVELISYYQGRLAQLEEKMLFFCELWHGMIANQSAPGTHLIQVCDLVWILPSLRWWSHRHHHNVVPPAKKIKEKKDFVNEQNKYMLGSEWVKWINNTVCTLRRTFTVWFVRGNSKFEN